MQADPIHSALVVHKGRPLHRSLFLDAFSRALKRARQDQWELILIDFDTPNYGVHKNASWLLPIQLPPPSGPLNKAKALNLAFTRSAGEYITIFDIDCLMPSDFLQSIERLILTQSPQKIAHHVRWIDPQLSDEIRRDGLSAMDHKVFRNLDRFNRYGEDYEGRRTGCSQQTINADAYLELGGFDEWYVGYGHEDIDFNIRHFDRYGPPTFNDSATMELCHLWHSRDDEWHNDATDVGNRSLFQSNKANGFPPPPIAEDWGKWPRAEGGGCWRTNPPGAPIRVSCGKGSSDEAAK